MTNEFLERFLKQHRLMGIEAKMPALGNLAGAPTPEWIKEGPVYEIFVRQFSEAGTLQAVQEKLGYLKDLGIKTIWLMPIHPIGHKDRKGSIGSPYAIADYMAIDPALGTKDDFKALVKEVHKLEMRLILDLVVNHTANDHPWHQSDPDFYLYPEKSDQVRKVAEWSDITDLNYNNKKLRHQIADAIRYWVKTFNIDGYRCDVAGLVPLDFWETIVDDLRRMKPDLFMLAEWQSSRLHQKAFHAYYDWVLYWLLRDIYKGIRTAEDIPVWLALRKKLFPGKTMALHFTENHDYPRTADVFGHNAFQSFAALIFLLPGLPLLYAGQEISMLKTPSLFEKEAIEWRNSNEQVSNFYRQMISLFHQHQVLRQGDVTFLKTEDKNVLIMKLDDGHNALYALLNFSNHSVSFSCSELENMVGIDLLTGHLIDGSDIRLAAQQVQIANLVEDDLLMV